MSSTKQSILRRISVSSHIFPPTMPPIALVSPASPQARLSYLGISVFVRRQRLPLPVSTATRCSSGGGTYRRSDFTNQPFTGIYEPGGPTEVSQVTLKNCRLDQTNISPAGTSPRCLHPTPHHPDCPKAAPRLLRRRPRPRQTSPLHRSLQPLPTHQRTPTPR